MNIKVADRVAAMAPSVTLAIDAKAKEMQASGIDVVNFGAGEPDFDTPEAIKDACVAALKAGKTKYCAAAGLPELKTALAKKFKEENGLDYKPAQISVNVGGKHSLYNAIMTMVNPGDEVIIPAPYWVSYYEMVRGAQGIPVVLRADASTEFKITPEQLAAACTEKTVCVLLNSPSNPTGGVYTPAELEALAKVIVEKDILCISDELYEKMVYDGAVHVSIATFPGMFERTLTVNGFSKAYSMTGWRLGYCAGPLPIINGMNNLQSHSTSNATTFVQYAALEALKLPREVLENFVVAFDKRRKFVIDLLNKIPGVTCNVPTGAFYVFPDFSAYHGKKFNGKVIEGSLDLASYILAEAKVGIVPGAAFGVDAYQRISYATSEAKLQEGVRRIAEALAQLED